MAEKDNEFAGLMQQFDKRMKEQEDRIDAKIAAMGRPTMPTHHDATAGSASAQPSLHYGKFEHVPLTESLEQVYCPTCGTMENVPINVKKIVETKEVIPNGYQKVASAKDAFDIVLRGHADGKQWYECENCVKGVNDFLTAEKANIAKLGWKLDEVKKK